MPLTLSIGTTGMSEICFQIIVILAFQVLYGYVYYKIGLILTSFMIGLVLGSFFINRRLERIKNEKSLYLKTQGLICLYPLILPLAFTRPIHESIFVFLPMIAGFLGGFQFPLANKICLRASGDIGKTTGLLYGIDLFGSCIGGLLAGLILIPLLGIIQTCVFLFIVNTLVLILLYSSLLTHRWMLPKGNVRLAVEIVKAGFSERQAGWWRTFGLYCYLKMWASLCFILTGRLFSNTLIVSFAK